MNYELNQGKFHRVENELPVLIANLLEGHCGVLNGCRSALFNLSKPQFILDYICYSLNTI